MFSPAHKLAAYPNSLSLSVGKRAFRDDNSDLTVSNPTEAASHPEIVLAARESEGMHYDPNLGGCSGALPRAAIS
jgi:hypothetical protein